MIFFLCISFFIKYIHKVELKTWPLIQSSNESCNTLSHYHQIQDFLKKPSQELKSLFCFRFLLIPRRPGTLNKKEIYFGHPKIYTGNMYLFCFFKKVLTPFCKKGVGPKFVGFLWHFLNLPAKLNIPSIPTYEKRFSPKAFGQTKYGLVLGRLAWTSSKTKILNKTGIWISILNFQVHSKCLFIQKTWKSENNNPGFKPRFNIL